VIKIELLRVAAGIVVMALIGLLYFHSREEAPQSVDASARSSDWRGSAPVEEKRRPVISMHPIAIELPPLNSPDTVPEDDLATIELVLLEYARHHQGKLAKSASCCLISKPRTSCPSDLTHLRSISEMPSISVATSAHRTPPGNL
jgi:hypothetical protein